MTRQAILDRVRERYENFPPELEREKLVEQDACRLSAETPRKWMVEDG